MIRTLFSLLLLSSLAACTSFTPDEWVTEIPQIGSSSSPMAVDLTGDGIDDIVFGGGGKEFTATDAAVVALDGATGQVIWQHPARNQIVGSAIFQDIDSDSIPDVFIGGRSAVFCALSGKDGQLLWEFLPDDPAVAYYEDTSILNFFNPQWVPDVDADGYRDILTAYGGFVKAGPEVTDRPVGYLMVISGLTGKTLRKLPVPDGQETYLSPVVHDFNGEGKLEVIFGTGGENLAGKLYRIELNVLMNEGLTRAKVIMDGNDKGFIAPPVLIDVNLDGTKDIVINSVDGRLRCLNGSNNETIWTVQPPGVFDNYTMPGPGFFVGNDAVPDFFNSFGKGAWPDTEYSLHTLVDGATGDIIFSDTLGTFQYASPVVADFTGNGKHDVLLAVNKDLEIQFGEGVDEFLGTSLYLFEEGRAPSRELFNASLGSNLGSTPLITDLDHDQRMDIIFSYMSDPKNFYSFKKLKVERRELPEAPDAIFLGNYMGPNCTSIIE
ncbi:PQQ-binding-like beta-propeller repeat protein [Lewinella sp. W8]|uniref:outer membrane protein assembly factor BamB family protein n=1 Tax=Lewinella sp. W8 TaxID=2528208 RepID=UPI00106797E4|nr:PQQ-binding-like beta-propeller repeat protein [Lewinella sp. W8]MTB50951.1 PQQ-binding-like beta-propeller repeat protein [Lewinella sp. W8]